MSSTRNNFPTIPNYRFLRKISEGGMATVYQAVQENLDREVALKIMSPAFVADKVLRESFIAEGKIIASLSHPHIITIHDIGMANNHYYMSMEYMPGETLRERIRDGLTTEQSILIIKQLAKALGYAHYRDFIHRDIKPGNVLFRHPAHAILTDFGVAKVQKTTSDLTRLGYMVGTPHYMSPEQANGKKLDHRSDLYSLGVLFYEMLTQDKPFTADDTLAIAYKHVNEPIPPLPPELAYLQGILDKLLAKDSRDRFPNTRIFITALEQSANNATRIMPISKIAQSPRKKNTRSNRGGHSIAHHPQRSNFLFNIKTHFSSLLFTFKLFLRRILPERQLINSDLNDTIKQMQRRQNELEQQLQSHQNSAYKLEEKLTKENNNRNTSTASEKPASKACPNATAKDKDKGKAKITELPLIDKDVSDPIQKKHTREIRTKAKEMQHPFPELKKPLTTTQAELKILSPEIIGRKNKLVRVETATSMLLLGQLNNTDGSERIHINHQLCRTIIDGYFCLKLHLDPKNDTNLTIKVTSGEKTKAVTHKLRQIKFPEEKSRGIYTPPTLTSMHNHALIIGNTHYDQFEDTAESSVDAHRLNKLFAGKFQYQTTCFLNATNQDILDGLNKIYTKFSKDDTLIIFYSGQSRYLAEENEGYWIPVDADCNKKETWFSHHYLAEILQLFPAKHILILTDSCFSAAEKQKIKFRKLLSSSKNGGNTSSGIVISSGGSEPQKSSVEKSRHSLFGGGLVNILKSTDTMMGSKALATELKSHTSKFLSDKKNKQGISYSVLDGHKQKDNEFFLVPSRNRKYKK